MRARSLAAPRAAALGDVVVNTVDSYQIRIAISGTSVDKYPCKSHPPSPPFLSPPLKYLGLGSFRKALMRPVMNFPVYTDPA